MDGNDPQLIRVAAGPGAVAMLLAATRRFGEGQALSLDMLARLMIVVEELVTNAVDHGGATGDIDLTLAARLDGIALVLSDDGTFFDPRAAPAPNGPTANGGGAGIPLILAWSRVDAYTRIGTRNRLRLTVLSPA